MDLTNLRHQARDANSRKLAARRKRNTRYRSDADFRNKVIISVKARHRNNLSFELYRKLTSLRSRIWWQRERINRWTKKLANAESKLLGLIREKELVVTKWKREKSDLKTTRKL